MKGSFDIVGGNLIDGKADRPRRNCSLRVKDGRVVALWEGARAPSEASDRADRVIDVAGKTVMPGLIDAHCHISYGEGRSAEEVDVYGGAEWATVRAVWNCRKVLRAGVTSFCDPGSTWLVAVTARDAIASGMRSVLEGVDAGLDDICWLQIFVTNIDDRLSMDAVRRRFFGAANLPAATMVEVARLALPGAVVEVNAIAVIEDA